MVHDDPFQRWQHVKDLETRHLAGRRRAGPDMTAVWLAGIVLIGAVIAWIF